MQPARAVYRATRYLKDEAPLAVEGAGGDETTYKVACRLRDFGVTHAHALSLLLDHWNERCSPPWAVGDLMVKIENAYAYAQEAPGAAAPEADFEPVVGIPTTEEAEHPVDALNREYAVVDVEGDMRVLRETRDAQGQWQLRYMSEAGFKLKFANKTIDGKPISKEWLAWPGRREYEGVCFDPGRPAPAGWYNLWRGFAVEPWPDDIAITPDAQRSLQAWVEHAHENVARGDETVARWVIGFFAHLVQRPWEKPLVALVMRGGKGVGKNALVERVGHLLGSHFLVAANKRYLVGNFNSHLERALMFSLDEAFWSGDKSTEGVLKDLITGSHHVIEHKGKDPYRVANRTRIVISGNEEWLVPSSHDERRFIVCDVGDGRKQDRAFFQEMREGMERGGYRLLLRYLQRFDLSGFDPNSAPATAALLEQKHASLEPFHEWWHGCLVEGRVVGTDFGSSWSEDVDCDSFRAAFRRHAKERNVRARLPTDVMFGKMIKKLGIDHKRLARGYVYRVGSLAAARERWDEFIGQKAEWE